MGISVCIDAIHAAIRSLSTESLQAIKALGCTLLASYAYDNFNMDLKSTNHTVEKSNESLKHVTSGLVFPLMHGVTREDLRCSKKLWESSLFNSHMISTCRIVPKNWKDLLSLHHESDKLDEAGLNQRDCFNAWKFLSDLIHFSPPYFSQFEGRLHEPEAIEAIPVVKMPVLAARAMDLANSMVTGNMASVDELLWQGGIENPEKSDNSEMPDILEYVVLFHGDLGTGEWLRAALQRRSIEISPWNCVLSVIFIPGLFHLKMACADALWRIFLQPSAA